jgi:hypothetical protein
MDSISVRSNDSPDEMNIRAMQLCASAYSHEHALYTYFLVREQSTWGMSAVRQLLLYPMWMPFRPCAARMGMLERLRPGTSVLFPEMAPQV